MANKRGVAQRNTGSIAQSEPPSPSPPSRRHEPFSISLQGSKRNTWNLDDFEGPGLYAKLLDLVRR